MFGQNNNDLRKSTIFNYSIPQKDIIYYSFEMLPSYRSDSLKVKFYYQILNNALVFNKIGNSYESIFLVKLYFKKKDEVQKRILWVDTIQVNEYVKTSLKDYYYESHRSFSLKIDNYEVDVQFTDVKSNRNTDSKQEINLKTLIENQNVVGYPTFLVNGHYAVNQEVIPLKSEIKLQIIKLDQSLNEIYYDILDENKNILFRSRKRIDYAKIFDNIELPLSVDLIEGSYLLQVYHLVGATKVHLINKEFIIRWWDKPELLYELKLALRPFEILLSKEEKIEFSQLNDSQKIDFFNSFWNKLNNSNTHNNLDLKTEFYRRVDYVVKNFTDDNLIGWDKDLGKAHLLYGFPTEKRKFYKEDKSFILWKYPKFEILFVFNTIQQEYIEYSFKER